MVGGLVNLHTECDILVVGTCLVCIIRVMGIIHSIYDSDDLIVAVVEEIIILH